ncbi:MAG: glycosyltransferase family 2 protein [Candidatus Kapabacteria bacterium]|nr:glycosyltransferase family 2 protein [Candidatus Kapabacteria bacterium]MDW8225380.1 glycosyltransferase family 2 protein [Bacteroidota bacterium]
MEQVVLGLYTLILSVLFFFGLHSLVMVYYYWKTAKLPLKQPPPLRDFPMVTVQLPIYNEYYVVERLLRAVCALDYPRERLQIQVLDDSTDETTQLLERLCTEYRARGFLIEHIRRGVREGFKAGALRYGLQYARGEFIAIFDADFVPRPDFLQRTLPYFADPRVGMVQTRWEHLNEGYSFLTRAQALSLDGHFAMEQTVRYRAGFFINFNGTAGVWRRECILDAGNWHADTLAEDLDLSYRAQLRGWRFVFLPDVTTPAELPVEINALKLQQYRWTKGAIEVARKLLPDIWRSRLPFRIKAEATVHLTSNIVFPFILAVAVLNVPVVLLKNTLEGYDTFFTALSIFVLAGIGTFLFYLYAQRAVHWDWQQRLLLFPIFLAGSMGFAVNNTRAVLEALLGKRTEFVRTPKYHVIAPGDRWQDKKYVPRRLHPLVLIELVLGLYFLVGMGISLYHAELAALPFQAMFGLGFGGIGVLSLRHALQR